MLEASEGDEEVAFHEFPESEGACDKVVAGSLPVALIPWLDHALLHLKPQAEECFQLRESNRLVLWLVYCDRLVNLGISKQQHLYLRTKNLI